MAGRGKVKCACLRCDEVCMVHRGEFDRAARPRCPGCGGPVDVVSERGKEKMLAGYSASRARSR
jgi:hypothetical protein